MGKFVWPDGSVYIGTFINDQMSGSGKLTWASTGNEYDGEWTKGKKNGYGTMTYSDKSVYMGGWTDDKRNGEGKMTVVTRDGTYSYEGEWVMDQKHGDGKYTWPNTDVWYQGNWE